MTGDSLWGGMCVWCVPVSTMEKLVMGKGCSKGLKLFHSITELSVVVSC